MEKNIRLRRDGSIDIEHYTAIGTAKRSRAARDLIRDNTPKTGSIARLSVILCIAGAGFLPWTR